METVYSAPMNYIDTLVLPNLDQDCIDGPYYYKSAYPYHVLSHQGLFRVDFSAVTIICGGNGTGKSTLLNVIAQKLQLKRPTPFNHTDYFDSYLDLCSIERTPFSWQLPYDISDYGRIITSDEVFDCMLKIRHENDDIDKRRQIMIENIDKLRGQNITHINCDDPASLRAYSAHCEAVRKSRPQYVRDNLGFNKREMSNGESGFKYFTDAIRPQGLYLLDEPENSLSAERQIDLCSFIASMARFENCQFIISTHSPFIMSMKGARLYNLDVYPARVMKWTDVECVKTYRRFFLEHDGEFEACRDE